MKKYIIFLLIIMSAGNYLSAQKSKFPPFRDFLAKRNQFSPNAGQGQVTVTPQINIPLKDIVTNMPSVSQNRDMLSLLLESGNSVYYLPQDNMPCVIPDESIFYNMPIIPGVLDIDKGIYVPFSKEIISVPGK